MKHILSPPLIIFGIVNALAGSFFWFGVWIPYYLRVTDYSGVALIEVIAMLTPFLLEIPTGALADLFGKKKTLMLALLFVMLGNAYMAISNQVWMLLISVILIGIGYALFSGAYQAFVHLLLSERGQEAHYDKVYSWLQSSSLIMTAIASAVGGFLFVISPSLPFIATACSQVIALILMLFVITHERVGHWRSVSFRQYLHQNYQGIRAIFTIPNRKWIIFLLVSASLIPMLNAMLDSAVAINLGMSEQVMGVVFACAILLAAVGNAAYGFLVKQLGEKRLAISTFIGVILTGLIMPFVKIFGGTGLLMGRFFLYPLPEIQQSAAINSRIKNSERATALSVSSMLIKTPYVFSALFLGFLMNQMSSLWVVLIVCLVYAVIGIPLMVMLKGRGNQSKHQ